MLPLKIFKLGGSEMLFYTFSWRYFLKKKISFKKVENMPRILRNCTDTFQFSSYSTTAPQCNLKMYTTPWPHATSLAFKPWLSWDKDSQGSITFQKDLCFPILHFTAYTVTYYFTRSRQLGNQSSCFHSWHLMRILLPPKKANHKLFTKLT